MNSFCYWRQPKVSDSVRKGQRYTQIHRGLTYNLGVCNFPWFFYNTWRNLTLTQIRALRNLWTFSTNFDDTKQTDFRPMSTLQRFLRYASFLIIFSFTTNRVIFSCLQISPWFDFFRSTWTKLSLLMSSNEYIFIYDFST